MSEFPSTYRSFVKTSKHADKYYGFDLRAIARIEPFLKFLYQDWWNVEMTGLDRIPQTGPAVIVGNQGSMLPWQALMLLYALMSRGTGSRRIHIMYDLDWIDDERVNAFLREIGFVPWSSENLKRLSDKGELVAIFPEGLRGLSKPFSQRHRTQGFDWTRLLPVVEEGLPVFPLATTGCDEAPMMLTSWKKAAERLKMPFFPISPFFPWLPLPLNLLTAPVRWNMTVLPRVDYDKGKRRDQTEEATKRLARWLEGEVQAELNRLLRLREK